MTQITGYGSREKEPNAVQEDASITQGSDRTALQPGETLEASAGKSRLESRLWSTWNVFTVLLPLVLALTALIWSSPNRYSEYSKEVADRLRFLLPNGLKSHSSWYPDLLDITAEQLMAGLEGGSWSSVDLTKAYILQIQEVNLSLHAVTEINPDAISIAAALDAERANGTIRSSLHGIPILLKDNIATMDQLNNTAGSYALLGATVPRDSTVAAKLRAAGVVILGKTALSQWANYRSTNTSNGWSAVGGQVTGAFYPNMDPSGSSSGSGVASSLGLALACLGTETDASILSPSSKNNLVGIKPTVGLTSRYLVVPISQHQDTVGPMANSVSDAAYILSVIAGKDERDNYTLAQPFDTPPDYTRSLNFSGLRGARIGVPRNAINDYASYPNVSNDAILEAFEHAIEVIRNAGATVVEANYSAWNEFFADRLANGSDWRTVLNADFVTDLPKYLTELDSNPQNVRNLQDVSNFTHNFKSESFPERNTEVWEEALSLGYDNSDYRFWEAYQHTSYLGGEGGVTGALAAYDLDALILPTDYSPDQPAYAGLPVITVPMGSYPRDTAVFAQPRWGLVEAAPNIPFGLSFLGPAWSEETLISFAYAYEQRTRTKSKIKPYIVPKTQLSDVVTSPKTGF